MLVRRNDELTLEEIAALLPEKIVISPGPCTPNESGISLAVIARYAGQIPLLGVCLGHQAIARLWGHYRASGESDARQDFPIYHNGQGSFRG